MCKYGKFHDNATQSLAFLDPALVGLVHSNLRDYIRVVLAQFLFSYSQYRNTHYYSWDQRDRLDVADNYLGMVD